MKKMNVVEMTNINAGGVWGQKIECPTCGNKKRRWSFGYLFWDKSTAQNYLASLHWKGNGDFIADEKKVHG